MSLSKTSKPPPGFAEYTNLIVELRLTMEETAKSLKTWGVYGPAAHPFVARELERLRRELDRLESVGVELQSRSKA